MVLGPGRGPSGVHEYLAWYELWDKIPLDRAALRACQVVHSAAGCTNLANLAAKSEWICGASSCKCC